MSSIVIPKAEHRFPGPRASATGTDRLAAAGLGDVDAGLDARGPEQDGGGRPVGSAHDVGADMDAVAAVGVEPSRAARTSPTLRPAATAVRVRGGVWPGPVGNPAVGLYLDDDGAHAAAGEGGAEQSVRGRDRVDRQLFRAHRDRFCPPDS